MSVLTLNHAGLHPIEGSIGPIWTLCRVLSPKDYIRWLVRWANVPRVYCILGLRVVHYRSQGCRAVYVVFPGCGLAEQDTNSQGTKDADAIFMFRMYYGAVCGC